MGRHGTTRGGAGAELLITTNLPREKKGGKMERSLKIAKLVANTLKSR
jgi:hypothetical protein